MTDDIAEASKTHRRNTSNQTISRERAEARRATRHVMADIKFSGTPYVICTCGWRYDGPETNQPWKDHKADVGERHT